MSYHLVVRPEVYDDLLEAQARYDQKEPGLGLRFLRAARLKIAHLSINPCCIEFVTDAKKYAGPTRDHSLTASFLRLSTIQ